VKQVLLIIYFLRNNKTIMKSLIKKSFTALSLMMAAAGVATAQTNVDMSITGSPSEGGVYPGFIHAGTFNGTFFSGVGADAPIGSVILSFTIPPGAIFDATYPAVPAGWEYTVVDGQNANLTNTTVVSQASVVTFNIPFKVVASITAPGVGSYNTNGQIQINSFVIMDNNALNNTVNSTISVMNNPLPLHFVAFEAKEDDCKGDLKWITAGERNNSYFDVEKGADGEHFASIGRLKSVGNTIDETEYKFVDESPLKGHNFYRIRQVDLDGKSTLTAIQHVRFDCAVEVIEMYPNPSTGIVYIKGLRDKATIEVLNLAGQKVRTKDAQNAIEGVNLTGLADGTYQLNVVNAASQIIFTSKLVKKN
jgi:hypothetical protein